MHDSNRTGSQPANRSYDLSFDSHGNLYVTDPGNNRIQKFSLAKNSSCRELLDTYAFL